MGDAITDTYIASSSYWNEGYYGRVIGATGNLTFTGNQIGVATDYSIPLTASTTQWQTAYNWGNHANAGYFATHSSSSYLPVIIRVWNIFKQS